MEVEKKYYKTIILMTISAVFWAGAFIGGKIAVEEFPPFALTFLRFFFASVMIVPIMLKYEKKDWRIKREDYPAIVFLGLVGMVGYHILFFMALKFTTAVNASMIAAINPLVTTLLAVAFLREKLTSIRVIGILIALFGVVLTISRGDLSVISNLTFNQGDLLMLVAVSCWATYSIVSRRVMVKYSPLILTTYSFLLCTLFTLPFAILENPSIYLKNATPLGWGGILYMAIFPSTIGYLVQQTAIKEIGPSKTAMFINLVPVFSMILSVLILKEKITIITICSGLLIIGGVYLTTRKKMEQPNIIKSKLDKQQIS